jgi:AraC-like DNA-binding protein
LGTRASAISANAVPARVMTQTVAHTVHEAIQFAMAGRSWTEAAHAAGFADSSHLTRTFRRMFGINPAALVPR